MTGLLPAPANGRGQWSRADVSQTIRFKLFPWQREFLRSRKKIIALRVGRRSGKSVALATRLITGPKALAQGFNCGLMAHKRDGASPVETELVRLLGPHLQSLPKRDGYVYTPTGAQLHIWTLGNRLTSLRAGRGEKYGTIVIDEAAWCASLYDAFQTAIEPTLADCAGFTVFASTPRGKKNDFYKICTQLADVQIVGSTADCNPLEGLQEFFIEKKRAAAKGRLNPKVFRQEYLGDFVDIEDALVSSEMINRPEIEPDVTEADVWAIHFGMDLAISTKQESDYSAIVAAARNRSTGDFFICDAWRFKENLPNRILENLLEFVKRWHPSKIAIESTQFQTALVNQWQNDYPDLPIVGVRPEKDKLTRFQPTAGKYSSGRISHAERLPVSFEEELTLFPVSEHDDYVDALAYAVMSFGQYWDTDTTSGKQWGGPDDYRPAKPWLFAA